MYVTCPLFGCAILDVTNIWKPFALSNIARLSVNIRIIVIETSCNYSIKDNYNYLFKVLILTNRDTTKYNQSCN